MSEERFFESGTVPEYTTAGWYEGIERAPHLEQPAHRGRLWTAAGFVREALRDWDLKTVSDMGCGDGGLLSLIQDECVCWGYDLQPTNVEAAVTERNVCAELANVLTDPVRWGDIAVCTEMIEHLVDPHAFVAQIPSRVLVASSPNGETSASHYEFHCWGWNEEGYRTMLEQGGWDLVHHRLSGFQVVLAVRP